MTTEHTPPPWVEEGFFATDEYGDFPGIIGGNGDTVCYIASFAEQPDLNLIKAAPDLLEACLNAQNILTLFGDDSGTLEQVLSAIAKAQGQNERKVDNDG